LAAVAILGGMATPIGDTALDVEEVRRQFPALARGAALLDGPAGSQVPSRVIDAVAGYLRDSNANSGGAFATSRATDALVTSARAAVAALLGTGDAEAIAFGPNMTTLTFGLSRALARTWRPGDEVVVTRLDHDANVWPWVLAARDAGATVRQVDFRTADCTLELDAVAAALSPRTRLVAVGAASNAVGTVNPVAAITALARSRGAQVFVDAVHWAPHRRMDVAAWDCDYLACSAYKFFGPHVGILWGRRDLLASLAAYQVRPAAEAMAGRWMTGTPSFEGIAGTLAAIDYLCGTLGGGAPDRPAALDRAFAVIRAHEDALGVRLLAGLAEIPGLRVWGIADPARISERVPTVAVTHRRLPSPELARRLAAREIQVWAGHFYAVEVTEALGLPDGLLRIGLLHYNTAAEVDRVLLALREAVST
jgi:cysteine desulfurase family protein (TIGR01976 family)